MLLFFSNKIPDNDSLQKIYTEQKKQDLLTNYLDHLFDYVDADPAIIISSDDSLIKTIWRDPKSADEKLSYYNLLINIAYHFLQKRQIPASIKWYEKAYQFYNQNKQDSVLEPEMNFEEFIAKPLGNNYTRMGDFSKALFIQQTAIQAATQKQLFDIVPGLYGNLATTYFHARLYDSVKFYIDVGLKSTQPNHPQILNLYNLKAEAFLESGQQDSAAVWNNRAMNIAAGFLKNNPDAFIITYLDKARILNQSKRNNEALQYLSKAWQMAPPDNIAEKVEIAIETGNAHLITGDTINSKFWHRTALSFFSLNEQGLYPDFKVTTALFGIATSFLNTQQDSAAYWYEKAVLNDYYTQQLLPSTLNSRTAVYANKKYSEVAIALHHQLYGQTKNKEHLLNALWLAEISKGRQLLSEQYKSREWLTDSTLIKSKNISDELKGLYLSLAETKDETLKQKIERKISELEFNFHLSKGNKNKLLAIPSFSDFKTWVEKAGRQSALLSYYWGESYIYTVAINGKNYQHSLDTAINENDKELKSFLNDYFYSGPDAFNNDPSTYYKRSNNLLRNWYLLSDTASNIFISADGPLHALPFEALSTSASSPNYMGEKTSITYNFSFLQQMNKPAQQYKKSEVTVFTFDKPHLGFSALKESENEKKFLSKKFESGSFEAASMGTEDFISSLQSGSIIHFASHAFANDSSGESFLVLKDKLYLGQLQYTTANCPLIVLAACETGSGQLKQGEGMESLGRAFISKGVDGVISTRWPVDDRATSEIIQLFYKNLKEIKQPAKALQLARQQYIANNNSAAAKNPWLWAAFTYQGINNEIEPASKNYWWLIACGLLVLCTGAIFAKRFYKNRMSGNGFRSDKIIRS